MHRIFKGTFFLTVPLFICGINKVFFFKGLKIVHFSLCLFWCLVVSIYFALDVIGEEDLGGILWSLSNSSEFFQLALTSFLTGEDFINNFEAKLRIVEDYIQDAKDKAVIIKTNILVLLLIVYKSLHVIMTLDTVNLKYLEQPIIYVILQTVVYCAELECIWRIHLVMAVQSKVDQIHGVLKELYPMEWYEIHVKSPMVQNRIIQLKEAYHILVELTEDITKAIQIAIIHRLVCDMIKIFSSVYFFTKVGGSLFFSSVTVLLGFLAMMTLYPCLVLEMIASKSFDIKVILIQQGLRRNIKSKEKKALKMFTSAIVDQPIRLRIFGSYDMACQFIFYYCQFLATYSIFILQTAKYKFF